MPKVRFPGSGGANDFGSLAWETLIIMDRHSPRRFVEKVDFITTPGYLYGPNAREEEGLSPGTGPSKVITDLCLFDFDPETKVMRLIATHPGITVEDVKKATGFEFGISENLGTTTPPTEEDLKIIHEVIDPEGRVFPK
jgi:glutaconate CoA-transferase subunit B